MTGGLATATTLSVKNLSVNLGVNLGVQKSSVDLHPVGLHNLQELREKIGAIDGSSLKDKNSFSKFSMGFPLGSVIEFVGPGKTEFLAEFLSEHPQVRKAWIESEMTINPYALWQKGVDLEQLVFIRAPSHSAWVLREILQSQVFPIVIASFIEFSEKDLRRLQILCERMKGNVFILGDQFHRSWVPQLQLEVGRGPQKELCWEIIKQRGSW